MYGPSYPYINQAQFAQSVSNAQMAMFDGMMSPSNSSHDSGLSSGFYQDTSFSSSSSSSLLNSYTSSLNSSNSSSVNSNPASLSSHLNAAYQHSASLISAGYSTPSIYGSWYPSATPTRPYGFLHEPYQHHLWVNTRDDTNFHHRSSSTSPQFSVGSLTPGYAQHHQSTPVPSAATPVNELKRPHDQIDREYFSARHFEDAYEEPQPKAAKLEMSPTICQVCGAIASGYHYGANTCDACKLFFLRLTKNKRKRMFTECRTRNCVVNFRNRSQCGYCRFKKCNSIGMKMNGNGFEHLLNNDPAPYM